MSTLRREDGTTLIELVVAMTILLVIMGAAFAVLDSGTRTERAQFARREALEDLRGAMNRMTKDVRQALSVSTGSTRSRLEMTTLILGAESSVVYEVSGGRLLRTVGASAAEPLAEGFTSADIFCYDPPTCAGTQPASSTPSIIQISASLAPKQFANGNVVTLATDVQLRNS